ncbi:MAG: DUF1186 domain-containing protein [Candidatus Eisenbacteria sp.]|nr:DUF1186 domain-containing protein [Candidatus Eisenbacteria bacterium]
MQRASDERIREILKDFEVSSGVYRRESVDAALELKDEIIPHLIGVLETVLSNPAHYAAQDDFYTHTYAIMLLGHFKEPRAHRPIVNLVGLPGDLPDHLLGDLITEDLPTILLRTCDGSLEHIRALALNENANVYCRGSALKAMAFAVASGLATRSRVLDFLGSLLTPSEGGPDSDLSSMASARINDLYPEELMDTIEKAFEDGLISPFYIGLEDFRRTLERGKEETLERLRKRMEQVSLDDIHASMSWWACFRDEHHIPSFPAHRIASGTAKRKRSKAERKRKAERRRKAERTSRRRNR